ncbi:MAG: hypothetical protein P8Z00_20170 [Anaerolineales bacterium]|jgi:hypothetical protein
MDSIVDRDTYYFGDYVERPAGNTNIDVMVYNIVDEGFFDPDYPFFVAGSSGPVSTKHSTATWSSLTATIGRTGLGRMSRDHMITKPP